jgi:spore maturation protein CgeB
MQGLKKSLGILYVGALWEGGTCLQRMRALEDLGHNVLPIDTQPDYVRLTGPQLLDRITGKLFRLGWNNFGHKDLAGANQSILKYVKSSRDLDILWIDKGLTIEAKTIYEVKALCPHCLIVGYSPDDMYARHNQSRQFLQHIHLYDVFFTTKSYGVKELRSLGCKRVEFIGNAFDSNTHRPVPVTQEEREDLGGPVGFIGQWEENRASSMLYLAKGGIPVRIWGTSWEKCKHQHSNLKLENKSLWGDSYSRAICSFDVNLAFLRKINRDLQTTRSVEIPACGAFMLAERTDEHSALFAEGKEADFFSSDEELYDKVKYYLSNPDERRRIAAAGRERCLKSGYSNHDRLKQMLNIIDNV